MGAQIGWFRVCFLALFTLPAQLQDFLDFLVSLWLNSGLGLIIGNNQTYIPLILILILIVLYFIWQEIRKKRKNEENRRSKKPRVSNPTQDDERYDGSFSKGFPKF